MSVRDRIAAMLSGAPQTGWDALPQSQNVIDERQPYPYAPPPPLRLADEPARPRSIGDLLDYASKNKPSAMRPGPDPYGFAEAIFNPPDPYGFADTILKAPPHERFAEDVALRRAVSADRRFTDVLEPIPAQPGFDKDAAMAELSEEWRRKMEAEYADYQRRGLDPGTNLMSEQ
jgi:hypothetical protein